MYRYLRDNDESFEFSANQLNDMFHSIHDVKSTIRISFEESDRDPIELSRKHSRFDGLIKSMLSGPLLKESLFLRR